MIDGENFFYKLLKNNLRTYDNIRKITTGQIDDYTTGCLLDYPYFKNYYKMIARDLSKQQVLDTDPKAIPFYCKSKSTRKHSNVFHYWRIERNHFRFFTIKCESTVILFWFNIISI